MNQALLRRESRLRFDYWLVAWVATVLGRILSRFPPRGIFVVLRLARLGAGAATYDQARAARQDVVSVSLKCAGRYCLPRSLATALLCRFRGVWPTWSTGVRTPPFSAHAWIEVDNLPVDEPKETYTYKRTFSIGPR